MVETVGEHGVLLGGRGQREADSPLAPSLVDSHRQSSN